MSKVESDVPYGENAEAQERTRKYGEQLQHLQWERDPMLLVLRGHLYVEQRLNYLLYHRVPSDAFNALKLSFWRKLKLARDLGIVSSETFAATAKLNEYRNRLAHNLDGEVGAAEAEALYALLEKDGVFSGSQMQRAADPMVTLSRCIRAIYALYDGEVWTLQAGSRVQIALGPWVTEEIDKDTFEDKQRSLYEEAQRIQKLINESSKARAEMGRKGAESTKESS